jgi:hypothetical protein
MSEIGLTPVFSYIIFLQVVVNVRSPVAIERSMTFAFNVASLNKQKSEEESHLISRIIEQMKSVNYTCT